MKVKLPEVFLDDDNYPTEEYLKFLKDYTTELPIMDVVNIICDNWVYNSYKLYRKYNGFIKLELHTSGWSGNEEVIREIINNSYLSHFNMQYYKWYTGGHYYFKITL